ncbi:hypothetical protein M408DRAFT_17108 [Serendipita vermifera MAFF 305830]|uniref:AB hydrolase-1 domain-containing protein n=1 Tax=Serendipita vermifera MAFF 305830 TaxID=933852 RepID=A0A0C3B0X3_SERVB|nr:hypothetical protein M408DRAFT_17108 [Serendipita vermifera MAFF 305830]
MPSTLPVASDIPDGFIASFKSWLSSGQKQSEIAEERILKRMSTYRSADEADVTTPSSANTRVSHVQLSDKSRYMNTLSILPTTPATTQTSSSREPPPTTVILHGYGAGLGFFSLNFETLSHWVSRRGQPVYLLDWLGMGRSSRPPFKVTAKLSDTRQRVEQAESFFLDSLEEWRSKMNINKMTLVGHSLGAYLVTAYALKYPQRVSRLVLLSPAGVNAGPGDTSVPDDEFQRTRSNPEPSEANAQPTEIRNPSRSSDVAALKKEQVQEKQKQEQQQESLMRRLFVHAWEAGYSPFGLLRLGGPWAPMLVAKYTTRRFADLDPDFIRDLHHYLLQISLSRGSGEYALSHILAPMAHARLPLEFRVSQLPKDLPVTFVYGSHDWMDPEGGVRSVERLKEAGNRSSRMVIIPGAGHHVYLDNPDSVNRLLVNEMDSAIGYTRRR